jgi:hypothetical protein
MKATGLFGMRRSCRLADQELIQAEGGAAAVENVARTPILRQAPKSLSISGIYFSAWPPTTLLPCFESCHSGLSNASTPCDAARILPRFSKRRIKHAFPWYRPLSSMRPGIVQADFHASRTTRPRDFCSRDGSRTIGSSNVALTYITPSFYRTKGLTTRRAQQYSSILSWLRARQLLEFALDSIDSSPYPSAVRDTTIKIDERGDADMDNMMKQKSGPANLVWSRKHPIAKPSTPLRY